VTTLIQLLGPPAGLISLGIILYDKTVSGRPRLDLTAGNEPVIGARFLAIFNPSDSHILIRSIRVTPEIYIVTRSDSLRANLDLRFGKTWMALLRPRESVEFPLMAKDGFKEETHQNVRISVSWYKTKSPWWPYWPLVIRTSTTKLRELIDATSKPQDRR